MCFFDVCNKPKPWCHFLEIHLFPTKNQEDSGLCKVRLSFSHWLSCTSLLHTCFGSGRNPCQSCWSCNLYQVVLKLQPAIQRYTAEFAATRPVSDRHRVLFHRKSNTAGKCVEDYDGKLDFKSNLCEEVQDYQDRCVNSTRSFQM